MSLFMSLSQKNNALVLQVDGHGRRKTKAQIIHA